MGHLSRRLRRKIPQRRKPKHLSVQINLELMEQQALMLRTQIKHRIASSSKRAHAMPRLPIRRLRAPLSIRIGQHLHKRGCRLAPPRSPRQEGIDSEAMVASLDSGQLETLVSSVPSWVLKNSSRGAHSVQLTPKLAVLLTPIRARTLHSPLLKIGVESIMTTLRAESRH